MKTAKPQKPEPRITVGGVTFGAGDVKSAVVTVDGRDVTIGERTSTTAAIGFHAIK